MEDRIREGEGQLREEVKAVPAQWVKMESLSNIIAEEISEKQVSASRSAVQSHGVHLMCAVHIAVQGSHLATDPPGGTPPQQYGEGVPGSILPPAVFVPLPCEGCTAGGRGESTCCGEAEDVYCVCDPAAREWGGEGEWTWSAAVLPQSGGSSAGVVSTDGDWADGVVQCTGGREGRGDHW